MMSTYHTSVLLDDAVEALQIKPGKQYIDGTLGGSGHTARMLDAGGLVLGMDVDDDAIEHSKNNFKFQISNFKLKVVKGNFRDITELAQKEGLQSVAGILLDLGVSGHQFDTPERGFSFQADAPLDMRMDSALSVRARDLVNGLTKEELTELFTKFGEERFARKIAATIADVRRVTPIETTGELEAIVKQSVPKMAHFDKFGASNTARVFQALRIAVNDELNSLRDALPKAISLLESSGRLVVITFHSLEDRIVKHAFIDFAKHGLGTIITEKPVIPTEEEIVRNSRSRSAKMRVFEKK